jgi:acetylornithine/succinyldiaminopimelate/putrescine aminotransferase
MKDKLQKLQQKYSDLVEDVRGIGLMLGMKMSAKIDAKDVVESLKERGLLTATAGDNVFRMVPPLIISKLEIQEGIEIIDSYLKTL